MGNIYLFSGPCGCGKSTLATAYAKYLSEKKDKVYLVHGDNFQTGFISPNEKEYVPISNSSSNQFTWQNILQFTWEGIIYVAQKALKNGFDVVIDYIVEDELCLVQQLAKECNATLYYVVLTATNDTIQQRVSKRGDAHLVERAFFLKHKLDNLPENKLHLFDTTGMSVAEELHSLEMEKFIL